MIGTMTVGERGTGKWRMWHCHMWQLFLTIFNTM